MKPTLTALLLTLCLMQTAWAACNVDGYYTRSPIVSPQVECVQCTPPLTSCTSGDYALNDDISTEAYKIQSGNPVYRCGSRYYNVDTTTCDSYCTTGCSNCYIVNDYCRNCLSGYVWNSDYSCLPLLVPFQITTMVFLLVALIGAVMMIMNTRNPK